MKVIAITERGGDYCIAVIQIPLGSTGKQEFVKFLRDRLDGEETDDDLLDNNTEYAYVELEVQKQI